ncbi:MAG: hypothetical protein IJZ68_05555 [Bacteroidaceae bacterium]|nr:hypothetical protein [Bacteroidaceae bacterium]
MNYQEKYVGTTCQHKNGMQMTIIAYQDSTHITVQFEDGVIVTSYLEAWRQKRVKHPTYNPMQPSLPECKVLYYLQPLGFKKYAKGYWKKFHPEFREMEFDAFNEQYQYAVEYDGYWAHNRPDVVQRDIRKEMLCKQVGITLIKIREAGLSMQHHAQGIVYQQPGNDAALSDIICEVIKRFNHDTHQRYKSDVNFLRDEEEILNLYASLSYKRKERLGETAVASNGMLMVIIEYFHCHNITVQFEDGTIRRNITYQQFQQGCVATTRHGQETVKRTQQYLGTSKLNNAGDTMTVISYIDSNDIDVQFSDGTIVTHRCIADFRNGSILNPNSSKLRDCRARQYAQDRLGEIHRNKHNETVKIIAYRSSTDVDVQFEDGTIREHVKYFCVKHGQIYKSAQIMPGNTTRIGEQYNNAQGDRMTIIEYISSRDVTVMFNDGTVRRHVRYGNVVRGHCLNPNHKH